MLPRFSDHHLLVRVRSGEAGDHHVLEHRHAAEELRDLEGPPDAEPGEAAGGQSLHPAPAHQHVPGVDPEMAGQQVDRRCLAGAVGTDQADQLACAHGEVDPVHRGNATEMLAEAAALDQRRHFVRLRGHANPPFL